MIKVMARLVNSSFAYGGEISFSASKAITVSAAPAKIESSVIGVANIV